MKTNAVITSNPLSMAEWVSCKDRIELSLIFMVAAGAGDVVLTSRGFEEAAEIAHVAVGGLMFAMLWIIPRLTLRNLVRILILGLGWSFTSITIEHQVANLLTSPVPYQEVSSQ